MLLLDTMMGKKVNRAPVMPKIWMDLAANIMHRSFDEFAMNPRLATLTVIEAAKACMCDGARLFLFPRRDIRIDADGIRRQYKNGRVIGRIDLEGGWATLLENPADFDFDDPCWIICYQLFKCAQPIVKELSDVEKLRVPDVETFHRIFGEDVDAALQCADGTLDLAGDCNSGTLAFCVSVLGMGNALMAIYDEPELLHALMEKGIALSINQAKFMIDKGLRILRYNDSVANMSVVSPDTWREFVAPYIARFCREVHAYCPEVKIYCHICGNVMPIIDDLIGCGLDCIAPLDPMGGVSLEEVRTHAGDDFLLMGGVDTMSFINKTPEEIRAEARECIRQGFHGGRYIVGSGCVVPRGANPDAIRALAQASRDMEE